MLPCGGLRMLRRMKTRDLPGADAFGVAIVRAWIEPGPPQVLKVRVAAAPDMRSTPRIVGVAADIDDACALVRDWLEALVAASAER
jgi:hypothetical protein